MAMSPYFDSLTCYNECRFHDEQKRTFISFKAAASDVDSSFLHSLEQYQKWRMMWLDQSFIFFIAFGLAS